MTRPGDRLLHWLARVCDERTIARLVRPTISDLQAEHAEAGRRGHHWRRRSVVAAGYLACARALVVAGAGALVGVIAGSWRQDAGTLRKALAFGLPTLIVVTLLLESTYLPLLPESPQASLALLALYLIPGMLPISVPAAFAIGVAYALHGRPLSRRVAATALALALLASLAGFVNMAWESPRANQRFREAVIGRPTAPGLNELTISEIRRRRHEFIEEKALTVREARMLDFVYLSRPILAGAPLVFTALALTVSARPRRPGRLVLGSLMVAATIAYVGAFDASEQWAANGAMPVWLVVWLPTVVVACVIALQAWHRMRGARLAML